MEAPTRRLAPARRNVPTVIFGRAEFVVAGDALIDLSTEAAWAWCDHPTQRPPHVPLPSRAAPSQHSQRFVAAGGPLLARTDPASRRSVVSRGRKRQAQHALALVAENVPVVRLDSRGEVVQDRERLLQIRINLSAHREPYIWVSGAYQDGGPASAIVLCSTLREMLLEGRRAGKGKSDSMEEMISAVLGCVRPVLSSKSHHYALSDMIQTRCHSAVQTRGYQPASTAPDTRQLDFSSSCGAFPRLQAPGEPRAGKIASTNLRFAADAPLEDGEDRLTSLPEELLIHILSLVLEPVALVCAMRTCKKLRRVCQDDRCWSFFSIPQKLLLPPYDTWSCYRRCKFFMAFADEHLDLPVKWQEWKSRVSELSPPRVHSRGRRRKAIAAIDLGSEVSRTGREFTLAT